MLGSGGGDRNGHREPAYLYGLPGRVGRDEARSLLVSRERDGIVGSDSVNDRRGQSVLPQAQRRFVHRRLVGLPASGKSRGRVVTRPNDRAERTPHPGQQCTSAQAVTNASIRFPDSSDSAEVTLYPSRPNNNVAVLSSSKPVALPLDHPLRRNTNDRRRSRAFCIHQGPDATVKLDEPH